MLRRFAGCSSRSHDVFATYIVICLVGACAEVHCPSVSCQACEGSLWGRARSRLLVAKSASDRRRGYGSDFFALSAPSSRPKTKRTAGELGQSGESAFALYSRQC